MKLKDGFILKEIAGQTVVVATGEAGKSFNGLIKLNSTAKEIWECLEEGKEAGEIAEHLTELFDIDREQAEKDVESIIKILVEKGFMS